MAIEIVDLPMNNMVVFQFVISDSLPEGMSLDGLQGKFAGKRFIFHGKIDGFRWRCSQENQSNEYDVYFWMHFKRYLEGIMFSDFNGIWNMSIPNTWHGYSWDDI